MQKLLTTKFIKLLFIVWVGLGWVTGGDCLAIDKPSITTLSGITESKLYFNDDTGFRDVEITPWSLENHKLGGEYLYLVTSYNTHLCSTPANMFGLMVDKRIESCRIHQSSAITPSNRVVGPTASLWSRDYYGAFSGHLLNIANLGMKLYTINHGELTNNNYFPPPNGQCTPAPDIGYGSLSCDPANFGPSYNGFVGMSKFDWTFENYNSTAPFVDTGPIVWPANGYVEAGKKASYLGLRHPTSIVKDGYLYVFYIDGSLGIDADGRGSGTKVARAPITANGIDPLSFKTYFNGGFTENALPIGFDKENVGQFFSRKGGRASSIFYNNYSFSVAKIKDTNLYLGVADDLYLGTTLQLSDDLIHWSRPTVVPGASFNFNAGGVDLTTTPFNYSRLANADGDSNGEIDMNDFFVLGTTIKPNPFNPTQKARIVDQIRLKLNLPTLVCEPMVNVKINNCSSAEAFNAIPRDVTCISNSPKVELNLSAVNTDSIRIAENLPAEVNCAITDDSIYGPILPFTPKVSMILPGGDGNKKVCVKLIDSKNNYLPAKCGGRIELKTTVLGDLNGDKVVDLTDFSWWKTEYLAGRMTLFDFGIWKKAYLGV